MEFPTFTSYKGRTIQANKPVKVYRNLHKQCYSVQQCGVVVGHCDVINMVKVKFVVSEAGRQRVIKDKKKNVHAFIVGYPTLVNAPSNMVQVRYNPYESGNFRTVAGSIIASRFVTLTTTGALASV